MQQAQEAAAEADAQGRRRFGLVGQGGIVQGQFLDRLAQLLMAGALGRVKAGEDHGQGLLESGQGGHAGLAGQGDRVADLDLGDLLDAGDDVADFTGFQAVQRPGLGRVDADLVDLVFGVVGQELDLVAFFHDAVDDLDQDDHAAVGVEPGIEDQRLQGLVGVAAGRRDALDDGRDELVDADPGLGARPSAPPGAGCPGCSPSAPGISPARCSAGRSCSCTGIRVRSFSMAR